MPIRSPLPRPASLPDRARAIIPAHQAWYDQVAWTVYGARPDKGWSLTVCISFAVMAELGLTEALTGDHHFEQAGFQIAAQENAMRAGRPHFLNRLMSVTSLPGSL